MEFFLRNEKINYKIYNHGFVSSENVLPTNKSVFWYIKYLFSHQGKLIHFHQFFSFHFLYYFIFSKLSEKKIFISIHGEGIIYLPEWQRKIYIGLLKNTDFSLLICVSKNLSSLLAQNGVENIWLPASVPPGKIQPVILPKIQGKDYFLFNIAKLNSKIAESIYGIELALQFLSRSSNKYQMLLLIGSEVESDKDYLNSLLEKHKVKDFVTVIYEGNLVNYLGNCKFLLRANKVDAYGVSIQEAIDLGIPALASDVCIRPKGSILFKKDNLDDLIEKVENIDKIRVERETVKSDFHFQLIELYKKFLN